MRGDVSRATAAAVGVWLILAASPADAPAQWTIAMRAMQNPLPVGQCTAIELVVKDGSGGPPLRPDGRQLDWQDFELEFTATVPDAFAWSNPRHRFLCARVPVASSATVVARYPGAHLQPAERVPGVDVQQAVVVSNLVPPGQAARRQSAAAPLATPVSTAAVPPTAPAVQAAPPPLSDPSYGQPAASGVATATSAYAPPPVGTPAGQAYQPPIQPPAQATAPALTSTPTEAQPAVKSLGGLFKKIGAHAKQKAGEVTSETAQSIASGATEVVDTTLETGGGVVTGAATEATNTVRSSVGGVGRSLTPVALRGGESSDNLATVMAGGGAELRMLRFTGTTDVLEPSARELIERLAEALNGTTGNFVIEAHVDPLPSPAASQQLSEHRAAAVKQALIRAGVAAARLKALGYGASEPKPEVPPNGGAPSSARIVMVREAVPTH